MITGLAVYYSSQSQTSPQEPFVLQRQHSFPAEPKSFCESFENAQLHNPSGGLTGLSWMLSSCGSHVLTTLHLCVTSDLILSHQLQGVTWVKELVICPGHLNNKFRWAETGHIRVWWSIRHHGQVCQQQRTTVSVCSGLGLQQLDGILNSFYYQPYIIPTKASGLFNSEQLYSEMFTQQNVPIWRRRKGGHLLFFFLVIFSSSLFQITWSCA